MPETQIKFSELAHFSPKQKEAKEAVNKYKYVLYGGAMGGGKSYWIRWQLLLLLMKWAKQGHKNVIVGLFCEDYPALKDRHISKISREFPSWLGTFQGDHKEYGKSFILNPEYGSGVIAFRNLDDPSKYQSAEFAAIAVDELTKNNKETFDDLRTRLRWPSIVDTKFISATNPGGVGHAWVKQKWMDRRDDTETDMDNFYYVRALVTDNPYIDASYLTTLDSLPEDKRRAFKEGDWDIFKGQFFSEFRRDIHVVRPFGIPMHWKRITSMDYGYSKPASIHWHAIDEDGVIWTYKEIYGTNMTYEELIDKYVSMSDPNEHISYMVADPAIWAKKDSPVSGADKMIRRYRELTDKGLNLVQANNDRIVGWNVMREYLKPYDKNDKVMANWQIFENCTELIRTLPSLIYDKNKAEDLDSDGEDHAADDGRYAMMSRPPKPPKENSLAFNFTPRQNNTNITTSFD